LKHEELISAVYLPEMSALRMGRQILQIIACYVIGLVVGNLAFLPYSGVLAPILAVVGAFMAFPILALAMVVFALMRGSILRHLAVWCIAAPFLIVMVWLPIEWETFYSNRGHDLYWYLSLRNVWEAAVLAFTCASISSALFWYWNRVPPTATSPVEQPRF
jgi:ABC-type antimicrobial peptide transport system permease subunit